MNSDYVHGYSDREARRLADQADTLAGLLHAGTHYPAGSLVLELGCGVGAQTGHLLANSPGIRLTCVDRSPSSLDQARAAHGGDPAVDWLLGDLFDLPFADASFDHLFVCFVLEHLERPVEALGAVKRLLRRGGSLTVIEGDHASAIFYPDSAPARAAIDGLVALQRAAGGDALIGRRLQPLLAAAGYAGIAVRPRTVYADQTRPALVQGFTRNTFTAMVAGARTAVLAAGLADPGGWDRGIADLERTAEPGGTFSYTFFKATAELPPAES